MIRTFVFLVLLFKVKSIKGANYLSRFTRNIGYLKQYRATWKKNGLSLDGFTTVIHPDDLFIFDWNIEKVHKILAQFEVRSEGRGAILITGECKGKAVSFHVKSHETLLVIYEVFHAQLYDFYAEGDFIAIDVGMNVGAASIFFSCFGNIEKVYSFEPFEETHSLALKNFDLNADLSKKIIPHHIGLAAEEKVVEVPLLYGGHSGASTTSFIIDNIGSKKDNIISISLKDAAVYIRDIADKHPGKKIFLKLDCEGAEYEIIEKLSQTGLLDKISVAIIEWHIRGKAGIVDYFPPSKFSVFAPNDAVHPTGMIYIQQKSAV